MIVNLFTTFDPATSIIFRLNWVRTVLGLVLLPYIFWLIPNRIRILIYIIVRKLNEEFKTILRGKHQGLTLIIISLFIFILWNNLLGLLPYVFTRSRHLVFTLSIALPIWTGVMIFGWTNNYQEIFAHLVPNGTPTLLIPFIVLIETIRNLIRPGSLAVRLTANIIAGHLLIRLLGNNMSNSIAIVMPIIILVQISLIIFEVAVSIIQAYVFSVLTTLYSSEVIHYE